MARRVLCIVADGVEEIELVAPVDILRRAGVEVVLASPHGRPEATGKMGIRIGVEAALDELSTDEFDALLLPGGPAIMILREEGRLAELARSFGEKGKLVAAICAAPLLLEDAGLLAGKRFTAHFATYGELTAALAAEKVVVDGKLITSRGAGTAVQFGLRLAAELVGEETAREVAQAIMS